jgi:adenylate kinase family enzyme
VIIPARLTVDLLEKRINAARAEGKTKFLLDGFPRSVEQAVEFEKMVCLPLGLGLRIQLIRVLVSPSFPYS